MKTALVLGAGGFIGHHLVNRLKQEGYWVRAVDLHLPKFSKTRADDFVVGDLRDPNVVSRVIFSPTQSSVNDSSNSFDEVYQLAADMGGAGFVFTGENDADIMHNSALININVASEATKKRVKRLFYSSSACIYPERNQLDSNNPNCEESSAYPAAPDSEYGWEKLFSERLYLSYEKNFGLDVRIARYHNIYGPEGTWRGGREKAPAAICRKVAMAEAGDSIEIWGDGQQTRSFLYVDDCIEGTLRLMRQDSFIGPVNIGSEDMVTINTLVDIVSRIGGKILYKNHVEGPQGVRGRNSDNTLIKKELNWEPEISLEKGLMTTYNWIKQQINK